MRVIHRADARWLDSCDEHRNDGGRGRVRGAMWLPKTPPNPSSQGGGA